MDGLVSLSDSQALLFRCVRPLGASEAACADAENLFRQLLECNFQAQWVAEQDCLRMKKRCRAPFIFVEFIGPAFEHLCRLGCRIFGIPAIRHHIDMNTVLPKVSHPLFCLVMSGAPVTFTNVERADRMVFQAMVLWMGGREERAMTSDCRFVVAEEVGSKKYRVAVNVGIPVLTTRWILDAWKRRHDRRFNACKSQFWSNYVCPPLLGLTITTSGMSVEEREEAKRTVEKCGGTFSGDLLISKTTHLVLDKLEGPKYMAAVRSTEAKVHIVSSKWLYDSASKGYALPEEEFAVEESLDVPRHRSTPMLDSSKNFGMSVLSTATIPNQPTSNRKRASDGSISPTEPLQPGTSASVLSAPFSMNSKHLEESIYGTAYCFENCRIWLHGFEKPLMSKLEKFVDLCGGILADLQTTITHVVLSDDVQPDTFIALIGDKDLSSSHVLCLQWFVQSFKSGCRMPEELYRHPVADALKRSQRQNGAAPMEDASHGSDSAYGKHMESILSQYLPAGDDDGGLSFIADEPENQDPYGHTVRTLPGGSVADGGAWLDSRQPIDMDRTADGGAMGEAVGKCFANKTFRILGCNATILGRISGLIQANGGDIVSKSPTFLVVPWLTRLAVAKGGDVDLVSPFWIESCVKAGRLLPIEESPFYRGYFTLAPERLLADCVICISQYEKAEKAAIGEMAAACGAIVQDHLARKRTKTLHRTTHLIHRFPTGNKYEGAKKWKLPCVSVHWLVSCIQQARVVDPSDYLVASSLVADGNDEVRSSKANVNLSSADAWASNAYLNFNQSYVPRLDVDGAFEKLVATNAANVQPRGFFEELSERLDRSFEPTPISELPNRCSDVDTVQQENAKRQAEETKLVREDLRKQLCSVLDKPPFVEKDDPPVTSEGSIVQTEDMVQGEPAEWDASQMDYDNQTTEQEFIQAPVDWDDPNQRLARQEIGCLLKEHDQQTQASPVASREASTGYLFQFTKLDSDQKSACVQLLHRLNQHYTTEGTYQPGCTHLIAGNLCYTGRILSAIANGCWLLHFSYVERCREVGQLVPEEQHEWISKVDENPSDSRYLLAEAGRRWRRRLSQNKQPAFQGWRVLLVVEKRQKNVLDLLQSAGASVCTDEKESGDGYIGILDVSNRASSKEQWRRLTASGMRCFKMEYIVGFLIDEPFNEAIYEIAETDFSNHVVFT